MKITISHKDNSSVQGATNACNIPARPRVLEGYAADMSNVIGSERDIMEDDSRFNPPEYDDIEAQEGSDYIEVEFDDVQITIFPDATWEYKDSKWARSDYRDGQWRSSEYEVIVADDWTVMDCINDLLPKFLPSTPGDYKISGVAELWFDVSFEQNDDGEILDEYSEVEFDYDSSRLYNFKCIPD